MSTGPNQKDGMASPIKLKNELDDLKIFLFLGLDKTPSGIPMKNEIIRAAKPSSNVAGRRSVISRVTDLLVNKEVPRFPENRFPI